MDTNKLFDKNLNKVEKKKQAHIKRVERNKKYFEDVLRKLECPKLTLEKKLNISNAFLKKFWMRSFGYFYSTKLEHFLISAAESIGHDCGGIEYKNNTFLHVMSEVNLTGGHTRVVERWIELSDKYITHSIAVTGQQVTISQKMKDAVSSRNGEIVLLEETEDMLALGLDLRNYASRYEYIILHSHPYDIIPSIAFGTKKFKRPVIFFNQADHLFLNAKSIADVFLDLRTDTCISKSKRLINYSLKCPIPSDVSVKPHNDRITAREKLGLSYDDKIIVLAGSASKFFPICEDGLFDVIAEILESVENYLVCAIGVTLKNKHWKSLKNKFKERIKIIPSIPYGEYINYVAAANLVIDSYPLGGGTVLVDAITQKTPFVSLENVIGQSDFVVNSEGYCHTKEELVQKVQRVLNDEKYAINLLDNEIDLFEKDHHPTNWKKNLDEILKTVPKTHSIRDIINEIEPSEIDMYCIVVNNCYSRSLLGLMVRPIPNANGVMIGIKGILEARSFTYNVRRYWQIRIFNMPVFTIAIN